ncbi:tRNA uridine-5-carboxymethylaminomethyl(34) synthesis enzyme MnmG [Bacteroidetes bacterium endosymbiont of Geopemphigus sp.]|uniref:tRNA uridine-5-carboxymethylaminomethyl(34) synthesis enzyme MnmG n=1 Tax=Bacteroidetes bacterium endosymbiont of Geopemphigus sp. TaxID=2047937 RepID=UPI000CD14BAD|nr:tRNA uridine-5-carboxymethylaminomethyl(34) synthesis enzyme MnmG [Bacteroidetes bacterium endosymbiont of Geopemphigus sp.]
MFLNVYDLIVVGGGHAGAEASAAAARMGSSVLLITMNLQTIGQMSCNPAMGGIAKGQIVREIDALGGYSGVITDHTMIQFRMLNRSKGPAMWSPRAQSDRMRFSEAWRLALENLLRVDFFQDTVIELLTHNGYVRGVKTALGVEIKSRAVILTNGTFLNGLIYIGEKKFSGGRVSEKSSKGLTEQLQSLGFSKGRMKTGTSPRVDGRSLDYSSMTEQTGDEKPQKFSYSDTCSLRNQRSCYITYTNEQLHDILRSGFDRSPMFNGTIQSLGPRYCPSIEDKIYRFSGRDRHQIFVEPEGWNTSEVYVNGFSTSLPQEVQYNALRKLPGFGGAKILRPGYAIEYDYFSPMQLKHSLETKPLENLFFAGQINGTTGYEEAAAQGLMAGINAHLKIYEKEPFLLKRNEAYIGVLIDDLVTKGTEEPYRMFTSRAEYRLLLRQDNADERLTPYAHQLGLVEDHRLRKLERKLKKIARCINFFDKTNLNPSSINPVLQEKNSILLSQPTRVALVLARPEIKIEDFFCVPEIQSYLTSHLLNQEEIEQVSIRLKYKGYIEREKHMASKLTRLENIRIPENFDYLKIGTLSSEAKEKLIYRRPYSIAQASRISGISPADISALIIHMGR